MLNNDVNSKTLSRIELLKLAQTLRVTDADVMTRAELRAAIERARSPESRPPAHPVSWLGKARRLIASVIERGLHLPEAATLIRGGLPVRPFTSGPPPVATVTLARIYAAQGHLVRAIGILDEVLVSDPDHDLARELRTELQRTLDERRRQEREQRAASEASREAAGAGAAATGAAASSGEAAEESEEAPPSEVQLAASELLGAVPPVQGSELEAQSAEEITLAGTAPELRPALERPIIEGAAVSAAIVNAAVVDAAVVDAAAAETGTLETAVVPSSAFEPAASQPQPSPAELVEAEAETRRGSGTPPPLAPESTPEPAPASLAAESQPAPSEPAAAPASVASVPAASVEPPRPAGLVLIETSEPGAYLYWELATPAPANGASNGHGGEPHWVSVVAHVPRAAGSERREYRFPVQRAAGAVRIEGLPRHAVVRAKLTRGEAPAAPALVVAGSVRVTCAAGSCDSSALQHAQPGFLPHPAADPGTLALRAAQHLASAAPLYY